MSQIAECGGIFNVFNFFCFKDCFENKIGWLSWINYAITIRLIGFCLVSIQYFNYFHFWFIMMLCKCQVIDTIVIYGPVH